jgi:hypothetical protein
MKATLGLVAAAILAVLVGGVVLLGLGYLGFSNNANGFEVDIKAKYTDNQNVYDNGWKRVTEVAQVPAMQVAGLKELYDGAMKGRYGAEGSKAMFQFIKEQNPTLDQSTYVTLQREIERFRMDFQANQTKLISQKQTYERFLTATTNGRFYNMVGGYPRIDLSKYDILTSDRTDAAFKTKKEEPLQLAPKKS